MSRSKHLRQQEVWRDLIRQHGADYWSAAVKRAERAATLYGWWILLAILTAAGLSFGVPDLAPVFGGIYFVNFGVLLYVAKMQESVLPFVPAERWSHYLVAILLGVLGCGILFIWLFMISSNGQAKSNLRFTLQSLSSYPEAHGATPPPVVVFEPEKCAGSLPEGYIVWTQELDRYLESMRLPTRHTNFQKEALAYGFAHGLAPADFVKFGYNKALSPEEMATLFGETGSQEAEVAPREEEPTTEVAEPPTPATEADENAQQEVAPKPSTTDRLTALFELYQSGAITSEEFKALRADLDRQ